jgi:hypothetical protein
MKATHKSSSKSVLWLTNFQSWCTNPTNRFHRKTLEGQRPAYTFYTGGCLYIEPEVFKSCRVEFWKQIAAEYCSEGLRFKLALHECYSTPVAPFFIDLDDYQPLRRTKPSSEEQDPLTEFISNDRSFDSINERYTFLCRLIQRALRQFYPLMIEDNTNQVVERRESRFDDASLTCFVLMEKSPRRVQKSFPIIENLADPSVITPCLFDCLKYGCHIIFPNLGCSIKDHAPFFLRSILDEVNQEYKAQCFSGGPGGPFGPFWGGQSSYWEEIALDNRPYRPGGGLRVMGTKKTSQCTACSTGQQHLDGKQCSSGMVLDDGQYEPRLWVTFPDGKHHPEEIAKLIVQSPPTVLSTDYLVRKKLGLLKAFQLASLNRPDLQLTPGWHIYAGCPPVVLRESNYQSSHSTEELGHLSSHSLIFQDVQRWLRALHSLWSSEYPTLPMEWSRLEVEQILRLRTRTLVAGEGSFDRRWYRVVVKGHGSGNCMNINPEEHSRQHSSARIYFTLCHDGLRQRCRAGTTLTGRRKKQLSSGAVIQEPCSRFSSPPFPLPLDIREALFPEAVLSQCFQIQTTTTYPQVTSDESYEQRVEHCDQLHEELRVKALALRVQQLTAECNEAKLKGTYRFGDHPYDNILTGQGYEEEEATKTKLLTENLQINPPKTTLSSPAIHQESLTNLLLKRKDQQSETTDQQSRKKRSLLNKFY